MTAAELLALAERVKGLTCADREVDAAVTFDLFATPVGKHKIDDGPIGYIRLDDQPSWNLGIRFPGKHREWFTETRKRLDGETLLIERDGAFVLMNSIRIEPLTASLDAVVSLIEQVLPGWGRQTGKTIGGAFYASTLREYSPGWIFKGQGFNEACALLAALLRAKAAEVAG